MDQTPISHIPEQLRRWLDDKIGYEITQASASGFYGLMNALIEETPEEKVLLLSDFPGFEMDMPYGRRPVAETNSGAYATRPPSRFN